MANFDSAFDYSKAILALEKTSNDHKNKMTAIKASAKSLAPELLAHNAKAHDHLEHIHDDTGCVLAEIHRVLALPAEDKARLYEYHMTLACSKIDFMVRILFNTDRILAGPNGKLVIANQSMSPAEKAAALRELAKKYPAAGDHTVGLNIVRTALTKD